MDMDIPSKAIDTLTQEAQALLTWVEAQRAPPDAAGLSKYAANRLERCEQVCRNILAGKVGIPAHFCTDEYRGNALTHSGASRNRSAILQMMVASALLTLSVKISSPAKQQHLFRMLIREISLDRTAGPPGLMPDRQHGNQKGQGGYAGSEQARVFFDSFLREKLARIDSVYESELSKLAPAHYDPSNAALLDAWGHAWTQATAAVATDMLLQKGGFTLRGVLQVLQEGELKQIRPNKRLGNGTLPTSDTTLRAELWASPLLCQILRHNLQFHEQMGNSSHGVVYISLKDTSADLIAGESYPTGLSTIHIYLTVWLERVASLLTRTMDDPSPMNVPTTYSLPSNLAREIAPGQHATVSALIALSKNPSALNAGPGTWFTAPSPPSATTTQPTEFAGVFPLGALVKAHPAPAERTECVGSVTLDWDDVCPSEIAEWMDLAFIVHYKEAWHAVVLEVEEDETDEDRVWLCIDPELVGPWGMDALRDALPKASWVYRQAGLGVFVAGAVELDLSNW